MIIVYDVNVDRVVKVHKFLKQYLTWMQNSVFEGKIGKAQLNEIKEGIKNRIKKTEDTVRYYIIKNEKNIRIIEVGKQKNEISFII